MDLTDVPDVRGPNETPPEFDDWEDPRSLLTGEPIRERMLDAIVQLREPTTVATVADRVDCATETARDYLEWFRAMGMVRRYDGRPIRYEVNRSYLRWRRVERIRTEFTDEEIRAELEDALEAVSEFRERFGADDPDAVSLLDVADEDREDTWEALSAWKTARSRAALLDAARREGPDSGGRYGRDDG